MEILQSIVQCFYILGHQSLRILTEDSRVFEEGGLNAVAKWAAIWGREEGPTQEHYLGEFTFPRHGWPRNSISSVPPVVLLNQLVSEMLIHINKVHRD